MRRASIAFAGLVGAACLAAPDVADAEQKTVVYGCEGRMKLHVTFDSDQNTAIVTGSDFGPLTLKAAPTGDGFHYASGKYTLRGRGNTASWKVGMAPMLPCVAE